MITLRNIYTIQRINEKRYFFHIMRLLTRYLYLKKDKLYEIKLNNENKLFKLVS